MLSLATFVKNEAHCLSHMLDSVKDYVDEIVIVDTGSIDHTIEIAKEYTDRIYQVEFSNFGALRTLTAHLCKGDWVLMLDADETIDNPEMIQDLIINPARDAYAFPRKRWLDIGKEQQTELEAYPDLQVRLFRNNIKYTWKRELHEYFTGAAVSEVITGPIINHFQDVFKDEDRKAERAELYQQLSIIAGVHIHGGKPINEDNGS